MPGAVVRAQAQGAIPPPRTGHVGVPKRAESGWDAWRPGRRERERERERELYWELSDMLSTAPLLPEHSAAPQRAEVSDR